MNLRRILLGFGVISALTLSLAKAQDNPVTDTSPQVYTLDECNEHKKYLGALGFDTTYSCDSVRIHALTLQRAEIVANLQSVNMSMRYFRNRVMENFADIYSLLGDSTKADSIRKEIQNEKDQIERRYESFLKLFPDSTNQQR